jgi:hypothetical protein
MRKLILSLSALVFIICSCTEDIDTSARYVFKENTVASYLEKHPEYSQYLELSKHVPVSGRRTCVVSMTFTGRQGATGIWSAWN